MHQRILGRRLLERQVNRTGRGSAVEPAIRVDAYRLAGVFLESTWLLNRLEQRKEACSTVSIVDGMIGCTNLRCPSCTLCRSRVRPIQRAEKQQLPQHGGFAVW